MADRPNPRLPLFYRQPELLNAAQHGHLRIRRGGYAFAAQTNAVPLAIIEFGAALRHYPIVFAAGDGFPVAVLGLDQTNRFVNGEAWVPDIYIPAYVRRYPFVFADREQDSFVLAIDRAAENVIEGSEEGEPLFINGNPSKAVKNVLEFCRDFHGAHIQTEAFAAALAEQGLLVEQKADARLETGRTMLLSGFKVVDREKFEALPDDVILAWHKKGWLALIHLHFLSLDRFSDLLEREAATAESNGATDQNEPIKDMAE